MNIINLKSMVLLNVIKALWFQLIKLKKLMGKNNTYNRKHLYIKSQLCIWSDLCIYKLPLQNQKISHRPPQEHNNLLFGTCIRFIPLSTVKLFSSVSDSGRSSVSLPQTRIFLSFSIKSTKSLKKSRVHISIYLAL